eukprot:11054871-Ditylum_brightwellii.AAC.1
MGGGGGGGGSAHHRDAAATAAAVGGSSCCPRTGSCHIVVFLVFNLCLRFRPGPRPTAKIRRCCTTKNGKWELI